MHIGFMAKHADIIVVGQSREPLAGSSELGRVRVERNVKGKPAAELAILPPLDPEFACDITTLNPGERALFFLVGAPGAYRIMHAGRGKLVLTTEGVDVPHDVLMKSDCAHGRCSLKTVLAEVEPWVRRTESTAFITGDGVRNRPSRELRCRAADDDVFECGVTGDPPPDTDLLCFGKPSGLICLPVSGRKSGTVLRP